MCIVQLGYMIMELSILNLLFWFVHISFLIFVLINIDHHPWSLKSIHDFLLQCGYISWSQTIISGSNTCITALKKHQRTVSKVSDSLSPLISMKEILLPPANEVCEGYVFTGVCLSTGEGGMHGCSWGACMVAPGGHAWLLGGAWLLTGGCVVAPGGVYGCLGGACMVAPWGCAWLLGGACMGYDNIRRYGQWAGSTHPTGMHSCFSFMQKSGKCVTTKIEKIYLRLGRSKLCWLFFNFQ